MTDIINLNKVRKAKKKQSQKTQAIENRLLFGTSSKLKAAQARNNEIKVSRLEQHRLDNRDDQKNLD